LFSSSIINGKIGGQTAMHRAAATGQTDNIKALITGGCNPDAPDWCGHTPLSYAALRDHNQVCTLLASITGTTIPNKKEAEVMLDDRRRLTSLRMAAVNNAKRATFHALSLQLASSPVRVVVIPCAACKDFINASRSFEYHNGTSGMIFLNGSHVRVDRLVHQ
jgi:ankyrin repeat protein